MTYDQYWNDDCTLVKHYRKAHEIRNELKNQELWLQGMYIYEAFCNVSPLLHAFAKRGTRPLPYPDKPYPITKKAAKEREVEIEKANRLKAKATFETWASRLKLSKEHREKKSAD